MADQFSSSAPDLVSILIEPDEENLPPIADAGGDQEIDLRVNCDSSSYSSGCVPCSETKVFLDGTASYDPDGDNLISMDVYQWCFANRRSDIANH